MNKPLSRSGPPLRGGLLTALAILFAATSIQAQSAYLPEPGRQQLLNGLQILFWQRPGDENVLLKMRIKSGAAFDVAGKAGMMALLGDALFPDSETRQYFSDELGGRLEVTTDYDGLTITMSGRTGGFERMVELLRNALVTTPLTPENIVRLREARLKVLHETSISPSMVADRAIAARLFGEFPYGRPASGSVETLSRVDRADLLLARERFLNSDNAVLAVVGGLDERRVMRTLRQLLGNWRKGDRIVPATFRQPEMPDARTLIVNQPGISDAEIRFAARGLARSDRDCVAATLLAVIVRERWQAAMTELSRASVFARHEAHVLPGIFVMGTSATNANAGRAVIAGQQIIRSVLTTPPTTTELERARNELKSEISKRVSQPGPATDLWLDVETLKLNSLVQQSNALQAMTVKDVHNTALRLFKDNQIATVIIGSYEELKPGLGALGKVELLGDPAASKSAPPVPASRP